MTVVVRDALRAFLSDIQGVPGLEPGNATWTRAQRYFPQLRDKHHNGIGQDLTDVYEAAYALPAHQHDATYAAAQLADLQRRFMTFLRGHDAIRPSTYAYFHIVASAHHLRLCDKLRRTRPAFRQGSRIRRMPHVRGEVSHQWLN